MVDVSPMIRHMFFERNISKALANNCVIVGFLALRQHIVNIS